MSTASRIRGFIRRIKSGQLFSTRQCLLFGTRGAVDQALYALVKNNIIVRVARGVFMRRGSPQPTVFAVAKLKAEAFGKRIFQHGIDAACALGFPVKRNPEPTFATSGRSSSFRFGDVLIRFKGASPRKLLDTEPHPLPAQVVRAFWALGKENCTQDLVSRTYPNWGEACQKLEDLASLLPAWMNNLFYWGKNRQRIRNKSAPMEPLFKDLRTLFPDLFYDSRQSKPEG